jgi:phosphoglycolate phosphatase
MRLVLFDIDGTLIHSGGAGMRAFYRAIGQVFDIPVHGEVISPDGKTDPLIAKEFLAHFGQADRWCAASREALFASYLFYLEEEMERARSKGRIRVLPGVAELLENLSAKPEFALGLVTGNLEPGARIKLAKAGLNRYFPFGGFGSDSEDRTTLVRKGIERGTRRIAPAIVEAAFVIGDTPLDIIHGRAAGAFVIAVASAKYSLADLEAHHPDLLVPDLTAADALLSYLKR